VCVLALFVSVPLAASPWFGDQFTTVKWVALEVLAVAWLLAELWRCGSHGWPTFVRERWPAVLLLGGLALFSSLRSGVAWGLPALGERLSFLSLTMAAYWFFRRNAERTGPIVLGAGLAAGVVAVWGLTQAFGLQPFPSLSAGDQRSASFGNVNMTAQFLGVAVLLLLAHDDEDGGGGRSLRRGIVVAAFAYLYFLACRSVFLGLAGGLSVLTVTRRLTAASLARMLGAAALVVLVLLRYGPPDLPHPLKASVRADKALSTQMRLDVWRSTVSLIRDHPLGVGSGNFGDAFIPYQLGLPTIPGEAVLFRTPHNEYLRTLAEEGVAFGALVGALLVTLLHRLRAGRRLAFGHSGAGALLGAGLVFLAIEAFFQFPFGTAFGSLVAALLLGLALAVLEPKAVAAPGDRQGRWLWRGAGTLVAAGILILAARAATSEVLIARNPRDAAALGRACGLDPRNLPACVTAAWLKANGGDPREARRLLHETLRRSPYYHPAIRLLGEVAVANGNREEGCHYLWIYDELFRERSAVHDQVGRLCGSGRPASLSAAVPMPYYRTLPAPQASPSFERDGS
jgi:hypothetical protein